MTYTLEQLIRFAIENQASDIHLTTGKGVYLRVLGDLRRLDADIGSTGDLQSIFAPYLSDAQLETFLGKEEIDLSFTVPNLARIRLNCFNHQDGKSAALRLLPNQIPTMDALRLPASIIDLPRKKQGLVLVVGPTGSGKSSTLASLINDINENQNKHIITIEDPIEYVHPLRKSLIHQREIGRHSATFSTALRSALREDPDIILLGEMRDAETISEALKAAETGHLVFSTLHSNSAVETVNRIVDVFTAHEQAQVRSILASTLTAVISQRLVPSPALHKRIPIVEILRGTSGILNLIREDKTHQIQSHLQTGFEYGMQTFEQSYQSHVEQGLLEPTSPAHMV